MPNPKIRSAWAFATAVAALLAATALWMVSRPSVDPPSGAATAETPRELDPDMSKPALAEPATAHPPMDLVEAPGSVDATGRGRPPRQAIQTSAEGSDASPRFTVVSGKVVVSGAQVPAEEALNGTMRVLVWAKNHTAPFDVDVVAGRFRVEIRRSLSGHFCRLDGSEVFEYPFEAGSVGFSRAELPDLGAVEHVTADSKVYSMRATPLPFGTEDVEVFLRPIPRLELHVVDSESMTHLKDVQVLAPVGHLSRYAVHPMGMKTESLAQTTESPLVYFPPTHLVTKKKLEAFVGAKGYGWERVTLNTMEAGQRTVELQRAAQLTVSVLGPTPKRAILRLYPADWPRPLQGVPLKRQNEKTYDSLSPGAYTARIELGIPGMQPALLAEKDVDLQPGEHLEIQLEVTAYEEPRTAPLSGTISIPKAWNLKAPLATFRQTSPPSDGHVDQHDVAIAELEAIPGRSGAYAFAVPPMEVGEYAFELNPLGWRVAFELPPGGLQGLTLALPPPIDVMVDIVDASTGASLDPRAVRWHAEWPGATGTPRLQLAARTPGEGFFRLQAPPGNVTFFCSKKGYVTAKKVVDVEDEPNVTLSLEPSYRATVVLKDGDREVPWPQDYHFLFHLKPADGGDGGLSSMSMDGNVRQFRVSKLGRYRVDPPKVNGFQKHGPVEFEIRAGERTEVVIQLQRK